MAASGLMGVWMQEPCSDCYGEQPNLLSATSHLSTPSQTSSAVHTVNVPARHTPQAAFASVMSPVAAVDARGPCLVSPAKQTACILSSFGPALLTATWEEIT